MSIQLSKHHGITLLVIALLPVLIALGNWQLRRAEEKSELLANYESRSRQTPVPLADVSPDEDLSYRRVLATGVFDGRHSYLLDNRVHDGRVGYEVLTPLVIDTGKAVLINRGWLAAGRTRAELPDIPPVFEQTTTVVASVYQPLPGGEWLRMQNETATTDSWPRVIQQVQPAKHGEELRMELFPYQLRINADQPGALLTDWQPVNSSPAKHRAYAWQWFAMAVALVLWQLAANTNLWQWLRGRQRRDNKP